MGKIKKLFVLLVSCCCLTLSMGVNSYGDIWMLAFLDARVCEYDSNLNEYYKNSNSLYYDALISDWFGEPYALNTDSIDYMGISGINFIDMDADGIKEMLVSYCMGKSYKALSIYTISEGRVYCLCNVYTVDSWKLIEKDGKFGLVVSNINSYTDTNNCINDELEVNLYEKIGNKLNMTMALRETVNTASSKRIFEISNYGYIASRGYEAHYFEAVSADTYVNVANKYFKYAGSYIDSENKGTLTLFDGNIEIGTSSFEDLTRQLEDIKQGIYYSGNICIEKG